MPAADPQPTSSGAAILRFLRVTLHVGFAVLLLVAILRLHFADGAVGMDGATEAAGPATPDGTAAGQRLVWSALALALAAAYLAGTVLEKRFAAGRSSFDPHRYAAPWLGLITALWGVLLAGSAEFSWVAFPLFFLHLHVLPRRIALFTIAAMTAAVVASQWVASGLPSPTLPMVLGPGLGAVFAVVTGLAYRALYQESEAQRLAADELRRTRAELARTQHEAGVAAERERLAREIHDTLAQGLSSIVLVARAAEKSLASGDLATAAERFALVQQTASENLAEARSFVRGLTSPQLQESSLPESLQRLCGETETLAAARGDGLRCRFELVGDPAELPPQYSVTLLRAAQASLANVRLHAKASTAVVTLAFLGDEVTLDVYDDGTGFVPEAPGSGVAGRADGSGFGLRSLAARVAELNGSLDVETAPGEGTVVALRLPLTGGDTSPEGERH
ncbi:sensor histidine kinase [Pseudarthrobacter sp. NIBRBAC000502772]|uniref:sensor histidine kinase n=1 Tax=Pseudarthrobacter sp. NIBRBAC000502772 TaxID=2590775 RepID=UPI00113063C0|nr:sensor histidine kinase [Pseudarthrobacter sp. NIBRBAC000502772]QDG65298.1 sensor histidine kinase [Pseudarthrobacter sp. NIBRBAC000502772]